MSRSRRERIGLFGGSFDPIHHGHLILARDVLEQACLDRVVFLPSARAPLREQTYGASDADRLAMVEQAIAGEPEFCLSAEEIERGGVSYSIRTVEHWRKQHPKAHLFWIIGADQVALLPRWHQIERLARMVTFLAVCRPGYARSELPDFLAGRVQWLSGRALDLSASEIRARCQVNQSIHFLVPEAVNAYIQKQTLYHSSR